MQNILVTGCNGLLGQSLVNLLHGKTGFKIYGFARGLNRNNTTKDFTYCDIDLLETSKWNQIFNEINPVVVFNCAAMTNVDLCEVERETCDKINVTFVKELINVCKKIDAHLIHISTDFIFDGTSGPYKENDKPNPINYYGLSKLKAENLVRESGISFTILRTILVFGKVESMVKRNIVTWITDSVKEGQTLTIVDDQVRMPTYVEDLAEACWQSFHNTIKGVFNISTSKMLSIHEMALQICEVFDLDKNLIKAIPTSQLKQAAMRPPTTGFDLQKSKENFDLHFEPFKNRLLAFKKRIDSEV